MSGDRSPDQPLRADATNEHMDEQLVFLMNDGKADWFAGSAFEMAREFAAACVVQCEEKLARAIAMNETLLAERNERDAAAEHQSALADLQSDAQLGRIVDMVASFTRTQPLGVRRFLGAMQMCGFVLTDVRQSLAPADWLNDGAVKAAREGIAAYVAARGSGPSLSHRMDTLCNAVASCGRGTEGAK